MNVSQGIFVTKNCNRCPVRSQNEVTKKKREDRTSRYSIGLGDFNLALCPDSQVLYIAAERRRRDSEAPIKHQTANNSEAGMPSPGVGRT